MNNLLLANIRKSLRIVRGGPPRIPRHLILNYDQIAASEDGMGAGLAESFATNPLLPWPWFYRNSAGEIASPMGAYFGFYALSSSISGLLRSLIFLNSGYLVLTQKHLAPAVLLNYTAAYHLVSSYLALDGRVLISPVRGQPIMTPGRRNSPKITVFDVSYSALEGDPGVVVAILTRKNQWKFEPRKRSHTARWEEVRQLFNRRKFKIPGYFVEFSRSLLSYGPLQPDLSDKELVSDGIERLKWGRHEALYLGFAYNYFAFDQAIDGVFGFDLSLTARQYRSFAMRLFNDVLDSVSAVVDSVDSLVGERERVALTACVTYPPFETELGGSPDLSKAASKRLDEVISWLFLKKDE